MQLPFEGKWELASSLLRPVDFGVVLLLYQGAISRIPRAFDGVAVKA